jgi:hypothetical protein
VRADCGRRVKGEGGGMVTIWSLVGGADIGGSCSFEVSHLLQLLDLDVAGESLSAGADVDVKDALEADDVTEVGRLSPKTNFELVPVDIGLDRTGERFFRNSR